MYDMEMHGETESNLKEAAEVKEEEEEEKEEAEELD